MSRWADGIAIVVAFACALLLGWWVHAAAVPGASPDGENSAVVRDASDRPVPVRAYQRIVSLSLFGDGLLIACGFEERVVAWSNAAPGPLAWAQGDAPRLGARIDYEQILALDPDLLCYSAFAPDARTLERLRASGVQLCDLGPAQGVARVPPALELLATVCGHPDRGARTIAQWQTRLNGLRALRGTDERRALYLGIHGDGVLLGGTQGTSYHDVLRLAGLRDVAAEAGLQGWPEYRVEEVLALAPELIVTSSGMAQRLRAEPGLREVPACRDAQGIIELPPGLLQDPGILIPDAAARLYRLLP